MHCHSFSIVLVLVLLSILSKTGLYKRTSLQTYSPTHKHTQIAYIQNYKNKSTIQQNKTKKDYNNIRKDNGAKPNGTQWTSIHAL